MIRKYVGALGRCKLEDRIHRLRDFEQCKCTSCGFEISEADERVATTIRDVDTVEDIKDVVKHYRERKSNDLDPML